MHRSLNVTSGSEHFIVWVLRLGHAVIQLNDSRGRAYQLASYLETDSARGPNDGVRRHFDGTGMLMFRLGGRLSWRS